MKIQSPITTHVLDINLGKPAQNLSVTLELMITPSEWKLLNTKKTNAQGRVDDFLAPGSGLALGVYRMTFNTEDYFSAQKTKGFYPFATIAFHVTADGGNHYHVPLLLSGHGYSTYRGT